MANDNKFEDFLKKANTELAAVAVGLMSSLFAGPAGGLAVAAVAKPAIERAFEEFGNVFTRRRWSRAEVLLETMVQDLQEAEGAGRQLRTDGYLEGDTESDWATALEHAFAIAVDDVTGKKATHIGHLVAELPYRSDIKTGTAVYLLDVAEDLTYDEFAILALAKQLERPRVRADDSAKHTPDYLMLLNMIARLQNNYRLFSGSTQGLADVTQPIRLQLSPLGELLYDLLRLDDLHPRNLEEIRDRFQGTVSPWVMSS